ncbi:hypothetical protein CTI12_AA565330 [Artemisia annua]|uniref:Uncharacterized protein n=1 Tax=Artemisia annua TaxID=35608 RepID=A0A2U1KUU9_ARTAN|nr:hypothetical protein CTI12_AA565330 [Artemisia annua]
MSSKKCISNDPHPKKAHNKLTCQDVDNLSFIEFTQIHHSVFLFADTPAVKETEPANSFDFASAQTELLMTSPKTTTAANTTTSSTTQ